MDSIGVSSVIEFLEHLERKAIIPKNTAMSRKSAAKKFFEILDLDEQDASFVSENFDRLYERFKNKNATNFKGNSLDTYRSRVKSVLDDFFQWKADPVAWERSLNSKSTKTGEPTRRQKAGVEATKESAGEDPSVQRLIFPLGPGVQAKVEIPMGGLTVSQLRRLGMFLLPYCKDVQPDVSDDPSWPMISPVKKN